MVKEKLASETMIEWRKEFEKSVKEKMKSMDNEYDAVREHLNAEEIIKKEVKIFGTNGAHISGINPKYVGRMVKIIIPKLNEADTPKNKD